jgi:nucleotide-binding universal stress UspA family protein
VSLTTCHSRPRLLIAYHGSPAAKRALQHAAAVVGDGGSVMVINVIPVQSVSARLETVTDAERLRQRRLLIGARSELALRDVRAELIAAAGDPLTEILAAADDRGADAIVVGRNGTKLQGFRRSLSSGLVRKATRDVLVVH